MKKKGQQKQLNGNFSFNQDMEIDQDKEVSFLKKGDEIEEIIGKFHTLTVPEQFSCLSQLLQSCSQSQLIFISHSINPSFRKDFIRLLPIEIACRILELLDIRSLCRASRVCKYWQSLIQNDQLIWYRMACTEANKSFDQSSSPAFLKQQAKRYNILDHNWRTGKNSHSCTNICHGANVVTCLKFDHEKIITASDDSFIKIWNLDGSLRRTLAGHIGGVWTLEYIDNILVSGATDRSIRVWNIESGLCIKELIGHSSTVRCLQMNKTRVVSGSRDQTLRIWDLNSGKCLFLLQGHTSSVRCVALHGNRIVSGSYDFTCRVWDLDTGNCLMELTGHQQRIYSLAFDGNYIVSGSQDATIRVYEAQTGNLLHVLTGHRALIGILQLDGKFLLSGSTDSSVRMWNLETGLNLFRLHGHSSGVSCLFFDENRILTGSDRVLKLWDRKTGAFIRDVIEEVDVVWRVVASEGMCVAAVQITGIASLRVINFELN